MTLKRTTPTLYNLLVEWRVAKQLEQEAVHRRREIEDQIKTFIGFDESREGNVALPFDGGRVIVTARLDRKVDGTLVRQLARAHNLDEYLHELFRWKAELELRAWKKAPEHITQIFAPAITTKPGRATFSLELEKGDEQ